MPAVTATTANRLNNILMMVKKMPARQQIELETLLARMLLLEKAKKLEEKLLPEDIDYLKMEGLRLEARQKLDKIRPKNLGQAGRISGVSPADIAVLMVYLKN